MVVVGTGIEMGVLRSALLIDCRGSVVYGATRLVAVLGADDLIVIDSPDAVLVCPREYSLRGRENLCATCEMGSLTGHRSPSKPGTAPRAP